jgi:hypothetical protein
MTLLCPRQRRLPLLTSVLARCEDLRALAMETGTALARVRAGTHQAAREKGASSRPSRRHSCAFSLQVFFFESFRAGWEKKWVNSSDGAPPRRLGTHWARSNSPRVEPVCTMLIPTSPFPQPSTTASGTWRATTPRCLATRASRWPRPASSTQWRRPSRAASPSRTAPSWSSTRLPPARVPFSLAPGLTPLLEHGS